MKRRNFVKTGLVATSGTVYLQSALGALNPVILQSGLNPGSLSLEEIYQGFQHPPVTARLFVRWWWNGNRLDAKEIVRELDVMKAAGIGGVEINPIAFPGSTDPVGYEDLVMFSDHWLDMLEVALKAARERGMVCDMIVGSGWPFGGEFLEKDDQTQMVTIGTVNLEGEQVYQTTKSELIQVIDPPIHSKNKTVYKEILMTRLAPAVSESFDPGKDVGSSWAGDTFKLEVPEGSYILYYVVKLTGYMAVINGAPGAAGPVLNHYSREATQRYLDRISGFLEKKIGKPGEYIRAMFCDSMELEGANWVNDLPEQFKQRRGYDLLPFLPFVLKKTGHMGNPLNEEYGTQFSEEVKSDIQRVSLDYYKTRLELFRERFTGTFNEWCHRLGVQSRMQAYGRGLHPLEASMEVDIPECETWLFKEVGRYNPDIGLAGRAPLMCNKYVSSGAVLADKKIISCEETTNTSMVFMATLENIKVAGDQSNLSGVNHSILHGFNYSPPEAKFPGWIRYGSYYNEQNTWWPYFRHWSDYKARLSYLLQNASPVADIAILQPLNDLWINFGPQRDPFPQKWYPEYQNNLWEAIHQNGSGCDYVSENIIRKSTFDQGWMRYGKRRYHTILLPEIKTLDLETVNALEQFAKAGGKVVCIGFRPSQSPDFVGAVQQDRLVDQKMQLMEEMALVQIYPRPEGEVLKWYQEMQKKLNLKPDVLFDHHHRFLSQTTYRVAGHPVFFIANTGLSETIPVIAAFNVDERLHASIWDPESGKKYHYPGAGKNTVLKLRIPRASSFLIVFTEKPEGDTWPDLEKGRKIADLKGPWTMELRHINGQVDQLVVDYPVDLALDDRTRNFAGEVIYKTSFSVGEKHTVAIDLGDVQGVSAVSVNGQDLGIRWYGEHLFDARYAVKEGQNELVVKITTIVGNFLKGLVDNPVAQGWTHYQECYPMGMLGPVILKDLS